MALSFLKSEFALLGIKQKDFRNILSKKYGIKAYQTDVSKAISGVGELQPGKKRELYMIF